MGKPVVVRLSDFKLRLYRCAHGHFTTHYVKDALERNRCDASNGKIHHTCGQTPWVITEAEINAAWRLGGIDAAKEVWEKLYGPE